MTRAGVPNATIPRPTVQGRSGERPTTIAPFVARTVETRVGIGAWSALTAFGQVEQTWASVLAGESVSDHARLPQPAFQRHQRALRMAHVVAGTV
ncbi:MAG: hypothetical protein AVDCRST_MAG64-311, partial [uncultured Phycisphaerae bacterium]